MSSHVMFQYTTIDPLATFQERRWEVGVAIWNDTYVGCCFATKLIGLSDGDMAYIGLEFHNLQKWIFEGYKNLESFIDPKITPFEDEWWHFTKTLFGHKLKMASVPRAIDFSGTTEEMVNLMREILKDDPHHKVEWFSRTRPPSVNLTNKGISGMLGL